MKSSDIHIRAISQQMPQPSIIKICMKITCLKFHSNFPGDNELRMVCFHGYRFYPCWRWSPGCQRGACPRKRAQWSRQNIGKLLSPTWDWHVYHCWFCYFKGINRNQYTWDVHIQLKFQYAEYVRDVSHWMQNLVFKMTKNYSAISEWIKLKNYSRTKYC